MSIERRRQKIEPDHPDLPVRRQCALISLSRSAFYCRPRGESAFNLDLMRQIDAAFTEHPYFGARQMMFHLRRQGHTVGRKRVGRRAEITVGRYVDGFYNPIRRHSALGYKSPCRFEAQAA